MTAADIRLVSRHKLHLGAYARVADQLGMSPSYVSLVVNGHRQSDKVMATLLKELRRIESQ